MTKRLSALMMAAMVGLIIVAIGLGFLWGFSNPLSWILIAALGLIYFSIIRKVTANNWSGKTSIVLGKRSE